MTRRYFILGMAAFLVVLAAGEYAARKLMPRVPSVAEAYRNPYRFRGWPEYIDGIHEATNHTRLVLLSNSQAYAGEYSADRGYPAKLEKELNQRRTWGWDNWKVMNLAIDGATSMEYMLMAAKLRDASPDLVLSVLGFADFRTDNFEQSFAHCRTDLPRLSGRPSILKRLPRSFLQRHFRCEDWLTAMVHNSCSLMRFREYFWCLLDTWIPHIHNVFYAPNISYRPWDIHGKAISRPLNLDLGRVAKIRFVYDDKSSVMLEEYLSELASVSSRVAVVSGPVRIWERDRRQRWNQPFQEDMRELVPAAGLLYWDMMDVLPGEHFITSSHFDGDNHQRFAELLANRIEELKPPTAGQDL